MKIGVITHWRGDDNYGQQLQCYALQRYLISQGHDAFLIRYFAPDELPSVDRQKWLKDMLRNCLMLFDKRRKAAYLKVQRYSALRDINKEKNKERKFREFQSEYLNMTTCDYTSLQELKDNPPEADAYIVGSDQVWRPSLNDPATAVWYLQFGTEQTKRISYAASMGRELVDDELAQFKAYLDTFTAVSMRETDAVEQCHKKGFSQVQLVLDPTLLAPTEIYKPFITASTGHPYIFLYYLNVDSADELAWDQLKLYMASHNLHVKSVSSSGYLPAMDLLPNYKNLLLTVPDWLSAIHNSQAVITTSFHGVALSIVLHRPFVAILLRNEYSGGNNRITSLLKDLGLENRILTTETTISEIMSRPINWEDVEIRLNTLRASSSQFLADALR